MAENDKAGKTESQQYRSRSAVTTNSGTRPTKQYTYTEHGFQEVPRYEKRDTKYTLQQIRAKELQEKKKRRKIFFRRTVIAIVFLLIIITFVSIYISRGKSDIICGTWAYDEITVYDFDGAGTGTLLLPTAEYAFSYSLQEDQVYINFEDENVTDAVYTFTISDGTLSLFSADGAIRFDLSRQ